MKKDNVKKKTKSVKNKTSNNKFIGYILLIALVIVGIIFSENLLIGRLIKKPFVISNRKESVVNQKELSPYAFKIYGIFKRKEKVFSKEVVDDSAEEQFNVNQGDRCELSTISVKGEKIDDVKVFSMYAYDEKLNHMKIEYKIEDDKIVFDAPMEIGTYLYIYEIEFDNKDKLTYAFYLNVLEMIDVALINNSDVEVLSYINIEQDDQMEVKEVYEKTRLAYYLNKAVLSERLSEEIVPDHIIRVYEGKFINQIDIFYSEDKVILYKEYNDTYYELPDEFSKEFKKII